MRAGPAIPLVRAAEIQLAVFDADCRRVRTLAAGAEQPGAHEARCDLDDDTGRPVAACLYFYRLRAEGRMLIGRVVAIR